MKKLLSIVLTVCMLMSLVIVPVSVSAAETEVAYEDTTLGSYYKFTFGEDDVYDYTVNAKAAYKGVEYVPFWSGSANSTAKYKAVTDAVTGDVYDTLEVTSVSGAANITPLTKDGKPFELKPGKTYTVKINLFNPISSDWSQSYLCAGNTNAVVGKQIESRPGYLRPSQFAFSGASFNYTGGWYPAFAFKEGTYGKSSTFESLGATACVHTLDEKYGVTTCSGGAAHNYYAGKGYKVYREVTASYSLDEDYYIYDAATQTYSADMPVYDSEKYTVLTEKPVNWDTNWSYYYALEDGSYKVMSSSNGYTAAPEFVADTYYRKGEVTGETVTINNYLTLSVGGGYVTGNAGYGLYTNYTYEEIKDDTKEYSTYLIESIEVYEVVTVKCVNGSTTTTVSAPAGGEIAYPTLTANIDYDYVWSLSATEYIPAPATTDKDITVYAYQNKVMSFENYKEDASNYAQNEKNSTITTLKAYTGTHSLLFTNANVTLQASKPTNWDTNFTDYYYYDTTTGQYVNYPASEEVPAYVQGNVFYKRTSSSTDMGMTPIRHLGKTTSNSSVSSGYGLEVNFSYKVSFKYLATENNTKDSKIQLRTVSYPNIYNTSNVGGVIYSADEFEIPAGATDGWQTGSIIFAYNGIVPANDSVNIALDFRFYGDINDRYTNEIYIDDITIEENFVNTPVLYQHVGDVVTTVTEGLTAGEAYTLPTSVEAPEGKYFIGWADAEGNDITSVTMPDATVLCEAHVYAQFGTYPDNVTYDTTGATQPTLKGYSAFTSSTLNESGWASRTYTAEGVKLEKALGGAYKWNPALDGADDIRDQTSSLNDYVALTTDAEVGTQMNGGWPAATQYILRDKDGNAIMAKPNTRYAITVSYEKIGQGSQSMCAAIGKSAANVTVGETSGTSTFMKNSSRYDFTTGLDANVTGENNTYTYYITTGTFAEGDVPVIGLQYVAGSFIVERVAADADGVESFTLANGTTYYPYKIVSRPGVLIKNVNIIEIDEGNVAVTFKTYEKGEGYTAVVKENVPGAALDAETKNYDTKWYSSVTRITNAEVVTTYPSSNATYYNATYGQLNPVAATFVTGDGKKNGGTEKEWIFENTLYDGKYALHIGGAKNAITTGDAETYMTGVTLQQGHTYKVTFKYKATAAYSKFGFDFKACQSDNFWSAGTDAVKGTISIAAGEATDGWVTKNVYFTADFGGTVTDESETGLDYNVTRETRRTLQMTFSQDANEAGNDLYFADIEVIDLGDSVIAEGGASVLTEAAADDAGMQAMRYYFDYKTDDGSNIYIGDDVLTVVERGFYYRNGYVANGGTVGTMYTAPVKQNKTTAFNTCWAYDEATKMMKFSTYVTGFGINDAENKVEVKAYIIVETADGDQFTIYADSINRTVAGVGAGIDGDINNGQ